MNRQQKRAALAKARRDIKHQIWTPFQERPDVLGHPSAPKGLLRAYCNSMFSVQVYGSLYAHSDGSCVRGCRLTWLGIRRHDEGRPSWADLQRIKNEILGPEAEAVQVMPPVSLLVDQVDMYWLMSAEPPTAFSKCFPMRA